MAHHVACSCTRAGSGPRMEPVTDQPVSVSAATFKDWYERLEEIVADDPGVVAPGNVRSAVILLHDLVNIGLRCGAVDVVVTRSTGPIGFAHLSYRYPLQPAFNWGGIIALAPQARDCPPEALIAEIAAATGSNTEDEEAPHGQNEGTHT